MTEKTQPAKKKPKKWTFLRKVRIAFIVVFLGFMAFFAICVAFGVIANLHWRHPNLDVPIDRPESLSDLGPLELKDCLTGLRQMHDELQEKVRISLSGKTDRDPLIREWKSWSKDWRKRFEGLGVSCRLTETHYKDHPTLGLLADIYRLLDYFQNAHRKMVKRFITENARPLRQMNQLFSKVSDRLEGLTGKPHPTSQ